MKQRIISAGVGLIVLAVVLCFYNTIVLNLAISFISAVAVYEILHATKTLQNKVLSVLCIATAAIIPFVKAHLVKEYFPIFCMFFIFLSFVILLKTHDITTVQNMALCDMMTLGLTTALCCVLYLRDQFGVACGIFYLIIILGGGWLTDTGAYFVGKKFGKRKMSPYISPKKTVEGAVGGVITCIVCYVLIGWIAIWVCSLFGLTAQVHFVALLILAPFASVAGILGDLAASIIKRQSGIKDFGNIMPGHGGVLDRFDSVYFVAPFVFVFVQFVPIIHIIG